MNKDNQVFGYVAINSNTMGALCNGYMNEDDFRRELQGKPISIETIEAAAAKVHFSKRDGKVRVHSFFPDVGAAIIGRDGNPSVRLTWNVPTQLELKLDELNKKLDLVLSRLPLSWN